MSEPKPLPNISIIIPVFDDYERLLVCLDALHTQTYAAERVEIIVVDNGSPPERVEDIEAQFERVRLIFEPLPGSYAARNAGITVATGEVIAFTDADCLPAPDWVERGVATLQANPSAGLVGGAITLFAQQEDAMSSAEVWEMSAGFPQKKYIEKFNFGATANVFTLRAVLEDVGGFNAAFHSGGDREWGERVEAAGYQLIYGEDVRVRHPARRSLSALLRKTRRTTRGDFQRQDKHAQWTPARRILRLGEAVFKLTTPLPRAGFSVLAARGSLADRTRFSLAQTLVTCTKEWEMARLLWALNQEE